MRRLRRLPEKPAQRSYSRPTPRARGLGLTLGRLGLGGLEGGEEEVYVGERGDEGEGVVHVCGGVGGMQGNQSPGLPVCARVRGWVYVGVCMCVACVLCVCCVYVVCTQT